MEKTSNKPLISVRALSKSFGELEVLKGVSTDIMPGEKVVVVGASGSGKSTFLRCLNCLEDPTGGEVIYDGKPIKTKADIHEFRKKTTMVFQDPYSSLNPRMTVSDIIGEPLDVHHMYPNKKEREERRF